MQAEESAQTLTRLLNHAGDGEQAALDALWQQIYGEVHAMARAACANESARNQVQPTLVVNELFLKMFGEGAAKSVWDDRRHFWGSVSRAMGQFLIDRARSEGRLSRGGDRQRVELEVVAGELADPTRAISPMAIRAIEALDLLEAESPECALVARLRFISSLSIDQTAILLEIAPRTVSKRWNYARAWLRRAIAETP